MEDVEIGDHQLLSTRGQSLLVGNGAFSDLDLALDVADCVIRLDIQCDRFAMNVHPRSATVVVESVQNVVMSDRFRYRTNLDLEPTQSRWNESCLNMLCSLCLLIVK